MCGRYYVDDETAREIEKLVRQADEKLRRESAAALKRIAATDIHPTEESPVLLAAGSGIGCAWLHWGFPLQQNQGKSLIINARCESAAEKPMFRESVRHRRIAVPASGFYEWDQRKVKYFFRKGDGKPLYMAGCCRQYADGEHFVILTTEANSSMQSVHDRMPLLLDQTDVYDWILDSDRTAALLRKAPPPLERSTEYEQMRFF